MLIGYPGLLDPCENGQVDVASSLTAQQRADITLSAQVFVYLSIYLSIYIIIYLSIYLYIYLSTYLSI